MDEIDYPMLIKESRLRIKAMDDRIKEIVANKKQKLDMLMALTNEIALMEDVINNIQQSIKAEIDMEENLEHTYLSVRMSQFGNRLSVIESRLVYDSTI